MKKKAPLSAEDKLLFQSETEGITPINQNRVRHESPRPSPKLRQFDDNEFDGAVDFMSDDFDVQDEDSSEHLLFVKDGIQAKTLKQLKQGRFNIEAELDLHGLNVDMARTEVANFLQSCANNGSRCAHIVHGKGLSSKNNAPVLKRLVNRWLRQRIEVLAFCSALPKDGGTGAVYVLLKNMNKSK